VNLTLITTSKYLVQQAQVLKMANSYKILSFHQVTERKLNFFTFPSSLSDAYLDDVLHSAAMEVTEQGTEASASTVARINIRRRPTAMIFDRPFVVAIVHRPTGEAVFLGRVEDPELDFE